MSEISNNRQFRELCLPLRHEDGAVAESVESYTQYLSTVRRKQDLHQACLKLDLYAPKSASLARLRTVLIDYSFPDQDSTSTAPNLDQTEVNLEFSDLGDDDDEALVAQFAVEGADAEEILGYDDEDELEEELEEQERLLDSDEAFNEYKRTIRLEENYRFEQNRRAGGRSTQASIIRDWEDFVSDALSKGQIRDRIIDEHHLLLYIRHCAERCKRDRRRMDIEGTFVGAPQLKKLYFGALRIRKTQEADDPSITLTRPVTSVHVWDSIKGRMREAIDRARRGLVPGEDAPDIVANTFLASITPEQIIDVGQGFLMHRQLHSALNGHLSWTAQNATANRGDDFRALKLAELQPWTFLHPNGRNSIPCILFCQGEEKAGTARGMKTRVNPTYGVIIAHKDARLCAIGALAFKTHHLHDVLNITESETINWSWNSSWREIRVLHGQKSPRTPYNQSSLYNLYVSGFKKAGFVSKVKVHLPRHSTGYQHERLGIDAQETARLGWKAHQTFMDHYAPSMSKPAVLGCHGYKEDETYDPIWRHVHVPDKFLNLVCPMAEDIHASIVGRENLIGASNYWSMVIFMRPFLFQCGATLFQTCPQSPIFKLPALANTDVRNWMRDEFPRALSLLQASAGDPVEIERVQNELLRRNLNQLYTLLDIQTTQIKTLSENFNRRTAVLSPTKGFALDTYHSRYVNTGAHSTASTSNHTIFPISQQAHSVPHTPVRTSVALPDLSIETDTGIYISESDGMLRGYANESPKSRGQSREKTQVDLVLPRLEAFTPRGDTQLLWHPMLGQKSATWDQVFSLIKRPELLWECWGPLKSLDKYSLDEIWQCYDSGEHLFSDGMQTGLKPPLRKVELHFHASWRPESKHRKAWERFREIPEFIEGECQARSVSPAIVINELEEMRMQDSSKMKLGLSALAQQLKALRKEKAQSIPKESNQSASTPLNEHVGQGGTKRSAVIASRRRVKKKRLD